MRAWRIVFTKQAVKDSRKIKRAGLKPKVEALLKILRRDPRQSPPAWEKLVGDLEGACSRRINIHHRLVHEILERERTVKIIRMRTHYE